MYGRIIGGKLIQLSDIKRNGYEIVEEEAKPTEREGYTLVGEYRNINNRVHLIWNYVKIEESEAK